MWVIGGGTLSVGYRGWDIKCGELIIGGRWGRTLRIEREQSIGAILRCSL